MGFILKIFKVIIRTALVILGLFAILGVVVRKLEDIGIIKSDWTIQKTPFGKGLRYAVSIKDKVFFSIQL